MKQLAWLNTKPREEKGRSISSQQVEKDPPTRLEKMIRDGIDPELPPVPDFLFEDPDMPIGQPVLVEWLMEIGPTEAGGIVAAVISWRALDAWCNRTGVDLAPWQSRLLRKLSGDWLRESDRATAPDCSPPWIGVPTEASRQAVENRLEKIFDRLG